jgi:hypothetical protein
MLKRLQLAQKNLSLFIPLIIARAGIIQVQAAVWYVQFTDRLFSPGPDADGKIEHVLTQEEIIRHFAASTNHERKSEK